MNRDIYFKLLLLISISLFLLVKTLKLRTACPKTQLTTLHVKIRYTQFSIIQILNSIQEF